MPVGFKDLNQLSGMIYHSEGGQVVIIYLSVNHVIKS